jgi:hypothetical protein
MSFLPSISPGNLRKHLPTTFKFDNDLTWTRPTQWLSLGLSAYDGTTPEKVKGLVAVYPHDSHNYVAFELDTNDGSSYTVNWGDGTTETLTQGGTQYHVYDYDAITSDTSTAKATTFRGYKQVIFEVTLTGSAKFSHIDFDHDGPFVTQTNYNYRRGSNILDLFVSSSNATDIRTSYNRALKICEQLEVRNTSSNRLTQPRLLYAGMHSLESIPFVPWIKNNGASDYIYTFISCHALRFLPDDFASTDKYWFKNSSRMQQCFQFCFNLEYLPVGLFGDSEHASVSNWYAMFYDCRKLKFIPYLGIRTGSGSDTRMDQMFYNCIELRKIPEGFSFQRSDHNSIDRMFISCRKVEDWSSIFDGTTDVLATINRQDGHDLTQFFNNVYQFLEIPFIGQLTNATDTESMFNGCAHAKRFNSAYTHLDLSNSISCRTMFNACYNLQEIPEIKLRALGQNDCLTSMFQNCKSLRSIKITGMISHSSTGEYHRMFNSCWSLAVIDGVDFSFATETSDYYQMFHICRDISAIRFPGTFRAGYASPRINVTVANHSDISGEYHITEAGTGYVQASGNGELTVAESGGNYTWTLRDSNDSTPTETSTAASNTQYTPWAADWSGATNAVTFTEVETGFKYTVSGGSGDGLRFNPIPRTQMLEIFNQLVTVSHSATLDIRNNSHTTDLTSDDIAIATDKGWTISANEGTFT